MKNKCKSNLVFQSLESCPVFFRFYVFYFDITLQASQEMLFNKNDLVKIKWSIKKMVV